MKKLAAAVCGVIGGAVSAAAQAGPGDAQVVAGAGTITRSGSETLIEQTTDRLAIDWQSFDLAADEAVRFAQPGAQSVALNRIFDQNPSLILGAIEANGRVYLMNPNGIVFGETARIDVGALLATSLDVPLEALGADRLELVAGAGTPGAIVNRGLLQAAAGGTIALVGGTVVNEGLIVADLGNVALGAGRRVTLDFDGDGLLYFEVDEELLANPSDAAAAVANSGEIRAEGGQVLMTARAAQGVFSSVVNNDGAIRAARIDESGGVVRLVGTGGNVVTSGTIAARGAGDGDTGGDVALLGDRVGALGAAEIDVSGAAGGGTISLGGGVHGAGDGPRSLYTIVADDVRLAADALGAGDGGTIAVFADAATWFRGTASARGGVDGGDGGFVEISGRDSLSFDGSVDTRAPQGGLGTLLFDPDSITIVAGAGPGGNDADLPDLSNATHATGDFEISEQALEGLAEDANIVLEATGDVVMQDLGDDELGLAATSGSLTIAADTDLDGNGSFTMHASDTIRTAGGSVTISGAAVTVGGIDVTGGGADTGGIALSSTGDVTVEGNLVAGTTIAVAVDTDNDGVATLRWRGGATATTVQLTGGADGNDVLEGGSGADTFAVAGTDSGTLNGVTFDDFATLNGAGGADTFNLGASFGGVLQGGAGADVFNLSANAGASIEGGADNDTIAAAASQATTFAVTSADAGTITNGSANVDFTAVENLTGGNAADTFDLGASLTGTASGGAGNDVFNLSANASATIAGGGDSDTIVADANQATTFAVTAGNAGMVTNGSGSVTFTAVENLTGSSAADTFNLGASLTGTASGGAGNDVFNLSANASATIAGGGDSDTIVADANQPTTFAVTSANAGTIANGSGAVGFTAVENLTGGDAADTFNLDATLSGTVNGGGGNDAFNLTANASATIAGGSGSDTIAAAANQPTTFTVTAANAGMVTNGSGSVTFTAVENLTGSTAADTFDLGASLSGTASGSGGDDVFNLTANASATIAGDTGNDTIAAAASQPTTFTLTAADAGTIANGSGAVAFSAVENLTGSNAADTFNLGASLTGTASGLGGHDVFNLGAGVSAAIAGGADSDTIAAAASQPTTFAVTSANAGTITNGSGAVGFSAVENLTGGNAADTFNLTADLTGTAAGGGGNDVFVVETDITGAIDGGADADTVTLVQGVKVGLLTGGSGGNNDDTLAVSGAAANSWLVNSPTFGVLINSSNQFFEHFENLTGGDGVDTFTFSGSLTGTASGRGGNDVFLVLNDSTAGFDGGAGNDFLNYSGAVGPVDVRVSDLLAAGIEIVTGSSTNDNDVLRGSSADDAFVTSNVNSGTLNGLLAFSSFEFLEGGAGNDAFTLNHSVTGGVTGGAGDDVFGVGTGVVAALDGGSGMDTLTVTSGTAAYTLTAEDAGTLNSASFVSIENLTGSANADVFDLAHTLTGVASGLGGNDRFILHAGASAAIAGGDGTDTLEGDAVEATAFDVTAANAGSARSGAGVVTFASVENLTGGAAADTFDLDAGLAGVAAGGGGDDVFDVASGVTATLRGDDGSDTLQGSNAAATYTISGTNAGTVEQGAGIATFTTIENLTAGAGDDTFNVLGELSGIASGGAGEDTFVLGANAVASIAGDGGADTIRAPSATATTFTVTAANAGTAAPGNGNVAFATVENLVGGAQADTFVLRGALTGSASGGGGNDTFAIEDGGSAGVIDGGAGLDTQTYAGMAGPVTVAIGGFTSIERLIGTADGGDTLLGTNDANAFATTGIDAGTVDGIAYESFEHLRGLGGTDTFVLAHGVSGNVQGGDGDDEIVVSAAIGGSVEGGAGDDAFTFTPGASAALSGDAGNDTLAAQGTAEARFDITAADAGTATMGSGAVTFASIENVAGGDGNDTFALGAALTGTAAGGGGDDRFEAAAGVAAVVDGGAGNDTLAADAAVPAAFAVTAANAGTLASGGADVAFSSVENLIGGDAADTFALDAPLGSAVGGAGDDLFAIGADAAGVVVGGAGNDSVHGSDAPTSFTLIGTATGSATAGGRTVELADIETVAGGAANDVFRIAASFAGAISGGGGDDRFELDASTGGNLAGDAGDDVFVLAEGVTVSGTLDGGAGYDTLDVASGSTTRNVVLTGAGAVDGFDGTETAVAAFRNVDAIVGGPGSIVTGAGLAATWRLADGTPDTYTSGAATLDLLGFDLFDGGGAADRFVLETAERAGDLRLRGGAGDDALEIAGNFVLDGDLTVEAVESVASAAGSELSARNLRIAGATGGIGAAGAPLTVAIDGLVVEDGAGGLYLVDVTDGLDATLVQLTGGDVDIRVEQGDLRVGFVGSGSGTDPAQPPANAAAGAIRLTAAAGSIERIADASPVDVRGRSASLAAFANVGTLTAPLTIVVPSDSTIALMGANATINNPSLAFVDDSLIAGLFSDLTANATAAAVSVGTATALQNLATIDWAGLDPNVALVDCAAPCLVLPEDQREDDAFAVLREATKLLLIRRSGGWTAVPVIALAEPPAQPPVRIR